MEILPEVRLKKENKQLILDTINRPAFAPNDQIYANLIGLHRPDTSGVKIEGQSLEGFTDFVTPLLFLLDTQREYSNALQIPSRIFHRQKFWLVKSWMDFGLFSGKQVLPLFGDFYGYLPLKKIEGKKEEGE